MRRTVLVSVVLGVLLVVGWMWTGAAQQQEESEESAGAAQATLKIYGMTCSGCAVAVKIAARSVDGVTDAVVSVETGSAEVTYYPARTTPEAIAQAVSEQSGFKATVSEVRAADSSKGAKRRRGCC